MNRVIFVTTINKMNRLKNWYQRWKPYIRVDVIMYLVMILLFLIIVLFYI